MDIEEFSGADIGGASSTRSIDKALVFPKNNNDAKSNHQIDREEHKELVPGTQSVWLKTYGCSHNYSDSEYMEGILTNYGFHMTKEQDEADIWVLNSCTVKDPSQAAFMHLVVKAKEKGTPVVVAGCVPQADRNLSGLEDVSIVGITQIDRVVEAVEQTLQGNVVKMLSKKALPMLDLPKIRKNPLVEIIPLSTGCLGACTYCKTRQARGKLGSYSLEAIVGRAKSVIAEGVSEIWLSSEDTGAYGIDIGTDIGKLLNALIDVLPETGVMLRVGMTNPPYILEHLEVVAATLRHPKVYAFLHVPIQAASNEVLVGDGGMNREYTVEEFRQVADFLIEHVPDMTVATDIICGFPNETEAAFQETLDLIGHYKLAITNISQFYPRPGTPAAKMKRIPTQVVKDRSRRLTKLFESFTPYTDYVGRTEKVWFDIEVSKDGGHSVGHTKAYVKVLVPLDTTGDLPGSCHIVKIHSCARFHVEGVLVELVHGRNKGSKSRVGGARDAKASVALISNQEQCSICGSNSGSCDTSKGRDSSNSSNGNSRDDSSSGSSSGSGSVSDKGYSFFSAVASQPNLSLVVGAVCVGIACVVLRARVSRNK